MSCFGPQSAHLKSKGKVAGCKSGLQLCMEAVWCKTNSMHNRPNLAVNRVCMEAVWWKNNPMHNRPNLAVNQACMEAVLVEK